MTIEDRVRGIITKLASVENEDYKPEKNLGTGLGIDSLDLVEIIMACEKEFGILINDAELNLKDSANSIIELIKSKLQTQSMS